MARDMSLKMVLFGEDRTASAAIHGVGSVAQSTSSKIGGAFGKLGPMIGGEIGELVGKVSEGFDQIGEHSKGLSSKVATSGAAIAGIGAAATLIGSKDRTAAEQLKTAIEDAGGSYSDYKDQIESTIKHQENFGHSAVQTQGALQVLTQATGDPRMALKDMGLAADLAAAKHISLGDAALGMAKVYGGSGKVLKEFNITMVSQKSALAALKTATSQHQTAVTGLASAQKKLADLEEIDRGKKKLSISQQIQLRNAHEAVSKALGTLKSTTEHMKTAQDGATKSTHAGQDALDQLQAKIKGQASASVDSWGGKLDVLKTKLADGAAQLGQKYGPALTVAGTGITALGSVMGILAGRQAAAAVATEAETAATTSQSVASKLAAAGQWLLNAAMDANPIGLIVIAIIALVAVFILAWKHSTMFRDIVMGAFKAVKDVVMGVVHWIQSNWPLLLAILTGPIGLAVLMIVKHWKSIKDGVTAVKDWIVKVFGDVMSFFSGLPGKMGHLFSGLFDGLKDAFKAAINFIISGWDAMHFKLPSFDTHIPGIGKVGGFDIGLPQIPLLAKGGIATHPTLAMIGEAGPEAVVPLSRFAGLGGPQVVEAHIYLDSRQIAAGLERHTAITPIRLRIV